MTTVFAFFAFLAGAQESQTAFNFLRLPVSAHVAALGGENITIAENDATLLFHNPALITGVSDRSANWNPKVRPPVAPDGRRYGVFSTRSPHRPNPIALSCVEVDRIDGAVIHLKACDLLDGTPVLDVKPYIPAVDAFPGSAAGWRDRADAEAWRITFSPEAMARIVFLRDSGAPDLESFCRIQLGINPFDAGRKRVEVRGDGVCAIGCRTWRILFTADGAVRGIRVETVISHYRADELTPGAEDRYGDKELHRAFLAAFPPEGSGS